MSRHNPGVDERRRWCGLLLTLIVSTFVVCPDPVAAAASTVARAIGLATRQDSARVDSTVPVERAAAAAEPAIELIEAGWDGLAVSPTWTPVRLRVTGGARDMRALVEAIVEVKLQPSSLAAIRYPMGSYGREIVLAAGSSVDVTLWVPALGSLTARLSSAGERLTETAVPLEMVRQGWPLIAVLADAPAVPRALAAIELPYQGLPVAVDIAELAPHAIPAASERFGAVSALVVQGAATAELTGTQRDAVRDWIRGGGHLVIAGGPGATQAVRILPEGTVPLTYVNVDGSAAIGRLGEWLGSSTVAPPPTAPVARFRRATAGAGAVLAGSAEAPLAWRAPLGRGTVTVLAVDPGIEPLASWAGAPALLRAALAPALASAWTREGNAFGMMARRAMYAPTRLNEVADLLPPEAHPGWRVTAAILAAFTIAVGPALFLVLRLFDRRGLSWLAVPAAGIGLSAGIYLWGVRASGGDVIANVVSHIEIAQDGGPARQSVAAAFYGPMHGELTVPLRSDVLVRPSVDELPVGLLGVTVGRAVMTSGGRTNTSVEQQPMAEAPFQLIDGVNRRVRFNTGQYATRAVQFGSDLTDPPAVRAELTPEGGLLVGTVHNETGLPLEDAAVIVGRTVVRLGTLAPGQSAPVRLDPNVAEHPRFRFEPLSRLVFGEPVRAPAGRAYASDMRALPNIPETQRRAHFLDATLEPVSMPFGEQWLPLSFIAYTRAPTIDEALLPADRAAHHLTLIKQRLDLVLPPGPFAIPAGLTAPDAVESSTPYSGGMGGNGRTMWIELRSGSLTYSFRPPLPASARLETLRLTTEQIGTAPAGRPPGGAAARPPQSGRPNPGVIAGPADPGVFSVYDWAHAAWMPLPEGAEHRLEAGPYVGPDGVVRVRIANLGNPELRVLAPSLAVEGYAGEGGPP